MTIIHRSIWCFMGICISFAFRVRLQEERQSWKILKERRKNNWSLAATVRNSWTSTDNNIKSSEGCEIVPCLKLSCCSFINAGSDLRLLGQRQRTLLLMAQQAAQASCSHTCPSPMGVTWSHMGRRYTQSILVLQVRNPELRGPLVLQEDI